MPKAARTHLQGRKHEAIKTQYRKETQALYGYRWHKASRSFLKRNPLCAECLKYGKTKLAVCVDHIEPHRGDLKKFWDKRNWQSLCMPHHNQKSAKEKL